MDIEELLNQGGQEEVEEGAPAWMATFADMSTLLLTFFILLLSFANMDAQKFREMLGSVKDAFGVQKETFGDYMARSTSAMDFATQQTGQGEKEAGEQQGKDGQAPSMEKALSIIQAMFQELGEGAEVSLDEEGVTVRIDGRLLFLSGSAELRSDASGVMDRVGALMQRYTFDLFILGHTDSVPIETPQFPSNWELSGARASAALRYLIAKGLDPQRLVAVGFADSRPIATNETPEGRSRNRRVEFLFKSPEVLDTGAVRPAQP
jgi:chemotaxis protein MotB